MLDAATAQSLVILADDLTGAADSAARCADAGMAAIIAVQIPKAPLQCDALACTSDSRHLPPALAAQRVRAVLDDVASQRDCVWYKKIDSTGRGNLGSEIDVMLEVLGRPYAIVCPAFPAQRRGLRHGFLVQTPTPAPPVHLPSLLTQQSRHPVVSLDLDEVRVGAAHLRRQVRAATRGGRGRFVVIDALTDDDLATIVSAAMELLPDVLLCGSAGLVGALAARLAPAVRSDAHAVPPADSRMDQPALIIVGSGSNAAHRQIAYLRRQSNITTVEVGATTVREWTGDILFHLPTPAAHLKLADATARSFARELACTGLATLQRLQPVLLVLVGGDTAMAVLERLGITHLTVVRELLPGMPLTHGIDRTGHKRWVIVKAGNHGDERTLVTLLQQVRSQPEHEDGYGAV